MTNEEMFNSLVEKMGEMEKRLTNRMDKMDNRIDKMDNKMDEMEKRLINRMDKMDNRIDKMDNKMGDMEKRLTNRMDKLQITLENETNPNIKAIAEGHLDLSRQLDEAKKINNEKEIMKIRLNVLESEVEKLKKQID